MWLGALLVLVTLVYANHFQNAFHFDDSHAVVDNAWIRDLRTIPRIFTDPQTFSTLPANHLPGARWSLRRSPLTTISLGLKPAIFQASTFFWFLVQLAVAVRRSSARFAISRVLIRAPIQATNGLHSLPPRSTACIPQWPKRSTM